MSHANAGARGAISDPEDAFRRAQAWAQRAGVEVCLADARAVFGADHLESAIRHARRAHETGTMTTHSLAMETLLYLSGRRQVAEAIRAAGLRAGTTTLAIALLGTKEVDDFLRAMGWTREDEVLAPSDKSLQLLGVNRDEESTVSPESAHDLALERTALVDVWKD